jgi:TRAP transporter TAXI family solute receptor
MAIKPGMIFLKSRNIRRWSMRGKNRIVIGMLVLCVVLFSFIHESLAQKKMLISMGTTASASAFYAYYAAAAKAINEEVTEVSITVLETGGAVDNAKRLIKGDINLSGFNTSVDYQAFNGLGAFEGKPQKDFRVLWYYVDLPLNWIVRKGGGIETLKDLNNKDFGPGGLGTATEKQTQEIFDFLGIKPKYHRGGMSDASEAFKDRRLTGITKAGVAPDPYIIEIATFFPIEIVGLSPEEVKRIAEKFPYFSPAKIPGGLYKGVEKDVLTVTPMIGVGCKKDFPVEIAYKMVKAMWEGKGRKHWEAAYPPAAKFNALERTLQGAPIPVHPGMIKYCEEKGLKVPDRVRPRD